MRFPAGGCVVARVFGGAAFPKTAEAERDYRANPTRVSGCEQTCEEYESFILREHDN